jgi:hypothetical protein
MAARCFVALLAGFLIPGVVAWGSDKPKPTGIGFVLDVSGQWVLDANPPQSLLVGQAVPARGTIRVSTPQRGSHISIVLFDGTTLQRSCRQVRDCEEALVLPQSLGREESVWQRAMAAVASLFAGHPEKYAVTMTRGLDLQDGVVAATTSGIDIGKLLGGTPAGDYAIRFSALGPSDESSTIQSLGPVTFAWAGEGGAAIQVPALHEGLFEARLARSEQGRLSWIGTGAWVLVCRAQDYPTVSASFQRTVELTRQLGENVRFGAVRSFLRAYLEFQAGELARATKIDKQGSGS